MDKKDKALAEVLPAKRDRIPFLLAIATAVALVVAILIGWLMPEKPSAALADGRLCIQAKGYEGAFTGKAGNCKPKSETPTVPEETVTVVKNFRPWGYTGQPDADGTKKSPYLAGTSCASKPLQESITIHGGQNGTGAALDAWPEQPEGYHYRIAMRGALEEDRSVAPVAVSDSRENPMLIERGALPGSGYAFPSIQLVRTADGVVVAESYSFNYRIGWGTKSMPPIYDPAYLCIY